MQPQQLIKQQFTAKRGWTLCVCNTRIIERTAQRSAAQQRTHARTHIYMHMHICMAWKKRENW